jgi:hypothetical protein
MDVGAGAWQSWHLSWGKGTEIGYTSRLAVKTKQFFGKTTWFIIFRDFLVSNFKNCLKRNTKKNLDMF